MISGGGDGLVCLSAPQIMSKVYKLSNSEHATETSGEQETDWGSISSKFKTTDGAGYKALADKLSAFKNVKGLLLSIL